MRHSLRAKLTASLAVLTVGFAVVIVSGALLERRVEHELSLIRERYIPQLALAPTLDREFEALRRSLQDAVAAQDAEALEATHRRRDHLLRQLDAGRSLLSPEAASRARASIEAYHASAYDVSRRLLAAESGERIVEDMAAMQMQHTRAVSQLKLATAVDPGELSRAFRAVTSAQATASELRIVIGLFCFTLMAALSLTLGQRLLRAIAALSAGFDRFGRGEFALRIPSQRNDELGHLARQANQMAESLERLGKERDRSDWLKAGHAGLVHDLRGELTPEQVAASACRFLARYLHAVGAALYYLGAEGRLELLGHHAAAPLASGPGPRSSFAVGEGLVGQAACEHELVLIRDLPADYLTVRSGLGECAPSTLALLPLVHMGRVIGVLELASLGACTPLEGELLESIQETLAIALEVAHARSAMRGLLARTQDQAEQLAAQEEELRSTNEELTSQQEQLQQINGQLLQRGDELESQHRVLEQNNRDLAEARRGLELKAKELGTVSAYKSQFLANMSHELRTPLNSMLLLSSILAENEARNLSDKQVEYCRTIHGAGKDLLTLINQVLDLAKVEAGKQELLLAELPLAELTAHARRIFEALAAEKGLTLETALDAELPRTMFTDRRKLEQVINNLLGNAIKFTERGHVRLALRRPAHDEYIERSDLSASRVLALEVSDTGAGIPAAHQARIFAPFEQLEGDSDRRHGGTGLGLTIARELTTLLGGELQLHSVEGQGSRFVCYLPLASQRLSGRSSEGPMPHGQSQVFRRDSLPAASQSAARPAPLASAPEPPSASFVGKVILVADDDMRTLYALSSLLRAAGAQVLTADTGRAALELLASADKVDLMLLDILMPEMDGYQALRELRGQPRFASLPVVALTAHVNKADRASCLEAGASDYLVKPVEQQRLFAVLQGLLHDGQGQTTVQSRASTR